MACLTPTSRCMWGDTRKVLDPPPIPPSARPCYGRARARAQRHITQRLVRGQQQDHRPPLGPHGCTEPGGGGSSHSSADTLECGTSVMQPRSVGHALPLQVSPRGEYVPGDPAGARPTGKPGDPQRVGASTACTPTHGTTPLCRASCSGSPSHGHVVVTPMTHNPPTTCTANRAPSFIQ